MNRKSLAMFMPRPPHEGGGEGQEPQAGDCETTGEAEHDAGHDRRPVPRVATHNEQGVDHQLVGESAGPIQCS